jgi:pyruvate/2-oxoglutarate dehydrogenase complex dihydrolipoamide dehydrogenase (E3) component
MTKTYDAIIIGTGQSGPSLAARLLGSGMTVAVIERKKFGGTCVNTGCIPTKTLVASARTAHIVRRSVDYGVRIDGSVHVDMKKLKARKDATVRQSNEGVKKWLKNMEHCTVYEGHARFEGPHTVSVGDDLLEAKRIFINVGARATRPPIDGLDTVDYFTNADMMEVDFLPKHLIVLGGSYIGLEFGQMYRRFGSKVTIVQRGNRLLSRDDEDVSKTIREVIQGEGIDVLTSTADYQIGKRQGEIAFHMTSAGEPKEIVGSHLLVAVGRVPNTDDLALDKAVIETDPRGFIKVDDQLHTSIEGVWALGDCNGQGAFTHRSYNDYEMVAANLLDDDPRRVSDRITAYAVYTDPPLGRVGMTEAEVRESGRKALITTRPMSRVGRAVEKGETQGFMKILVDVETKNILGASFLGVEADEAIHSILDIMYAGAPYAVIQRAVHIHPTVSELIPTMLGELKPLQ